MFAQALPFSCADRQYPFERLSATSNCFSLFITGSPYSHLTVLFTTIGLGDKAVPINLTQDPVGDSSCNLFLVMMHCDSIHDLEGFRNATLDVVWLFFSGGEVFELLSLLS